MMLAGMLGGAAWAFVPAYMRAKGWVNETISTLLLNYVAPLVSAFYIFGPWRSAESAAYPQTPAFVKAARLPALDGTRIHLGLIFGLVVLILYWLLMNRTRWGLEMRAIGGNAAAAKRLGIPLQRFIILALCVGGAMAGLAGMAEVSAIQGRLRQGISPGFGFMGFLISWLAGGDPVKIAVMSFVVAVITSGGDTLQITQGVPFAVINVLMALILFVVLARPAVKE
jgi:simple sugar transport system permease protein